MTTKKPLIFIFIFLFCSSVLFMESTGSTVCNEALCASIVSKCTLLKSCECEITPTGCECCKKCFACLEYLQAECCSCVGLCPTNNLTTLQNPKSVVGDIDNNTPKLWDKLMVKDDEDGRWRTFRNTQESNCTIAALSTEWVTPNAKMIANRWALPVIEGSTMVAATVMVTVASITDKILLLVAFQQLQLQLIQITRL